MKQLVCRIFCGLSLLALATAAQAQEQTAALSKINETAPPVAAPTPIPECSLCRWFELKTATLNTRFLYNDDSQGKINARQNQHKEVFEGRFKFDAGGKLSLNFGLYSGTYFAGGWSDSGWGRGKGTARPFLKRLYLAVQPVEGVEFQYGGLGILKGQTSAITGYADDGYVTGQRLVVERPDKLFFDQVAVTYAYLGDIFAPDMSKRYHRLRQSNFHQFLVSKKLGKRATVSGDYTFHNGAETLRQAISINTKELRVIDTFRFENYQRTDVNPAYGFAVTGERQLFKRLTLGGGFAQVDRHFGPYNADAFFDGRRVIVSSNIVLSPELSISTLYNRAVANNYAVNNRTLLSIAFHYDLLRALRRSGIF